MDKQLARRLAPLMTHEVQTALKELIEYRKEVAIRNIVNLNDDHQIHINQGRVRELDYLRDIRERIVERTN